MSCFRLALEGEVRKTSYVGYDEYTARYYGLRSLFFAASSLEPDDWAASSST